MALYRESPKCPHCGEITHKAIYRDQSHLPTIQQIIGDTFEGWKDLGHTCKEGETFFQSLKGLFKK